MNLYPAIRDSESHAAVMLHPLRDNWEYVVVRYDWQKYGIQVTYYNEYDHVSFQISNYHTCSWNELKRHLPQEMVISDEWEPHEYCDIDTLEKQRRLWRKKKGTQRGLSGHARKTRTLRFEEYFT